MYLNRKTFSSDDDKADAVFSSSKGMCNCSKSQAQESLSLTESPEHKKTLTTPEGKRYKRSVPQRPWDYFFLVL